MSKVCVTPLDTDMVLGKMPMAEASSRNSELRAWAYHAGSIFSSAYPAVLEIETTSRCRMRCIQCPRKFLLSRPTGDMDLGLLERVLGELRPYAQDIHSDGRAIINFMHYGEPSLHPEYGRTVALAQNMGLNVITSSTASEPSEEILRAAVDNRQAVIWLIFDGMDDNVFQAIRGPRASFTLGLERLRWLIDYKKSTSSLWPTIKVFMIKNPLNRHQWKDFLSFFGAMEGVEAALGEYSTFSGRVPAILDQAQRLAEGGESEAREANRVAALNAHVCHYPWHSVSVLWDGRVVPCCRDVNADFVLGDLRHQSLVEIWNGPRMTSLRQSFLSGNRGNPLCYLCREGSLEIGIPPRPGPAAIATCQALWPNLDLGSFPKESSIA
ncbi:MAG: SPASM domain-containing protein [Desulfovibrio sp.]|nr:SPASM domain-containing protein [Desulfovibrio sp.]